MTEGKRQGKHSRPHKPTGSPLLYHKGSRQWTVKVKWGCSRRTVYLGPDHAEAMRRWLEEKDEWLAGRIPQRRKDGVRVSHACDLYLDSLEDRARMGEITALHVKDVKKTLDRLVEAYGTFSIDRLTEDDWLRWSRTLMHKAQPEKPLSPIARDMHLRRLRAFLAWLKRQRWAPTLDVGEALKPVPAKLIRTQVERAKSRPIAPDDIRDVLKIANPLMRCCILLSVNAAMYPCDLAALTGRDIRGSWLVTTRIKTGTGRRAFLWPETLEALNAYVRPSPRNPEDMSRIFLTSRGNPLQDDQGGTAVSGELAKLCKRAGHKFTMIDLRRIFQSEGANGCGDLQAIAVTMGHVQSSMAARYTRIIADERIERVSRAVRDWLFGSA